MIAGLLAKRGRRPLHLRRTWLIVGWQVAAVCALVVAACVAGCRDPDAGVAEAPSTVSAHDEPDAARGDRASADDAEPEPTDSPSPNPSDSPQTQAAPDMPRPTPTGYADPGNAVARILDASPLPSVWVSPDRALWLMMTRPSAPSVAELARDYVALAGIRIDPARMDRRGWSHGTALSFLDPVSGTERAIEIPLDEPAIDDVRWSPDSATIAFSTVHDDGLALWLLDTTTASVRQVLEAGDLHGVFGAGFRWVPAGERYVLAVNLVDSEHRDRARTLEANPPLDGPVTLETGDGAARNRTYQDLLENEWDKDRFEALGTSQLAILDPDSGETESVGEPALHVSVQPSPDGRFLLTRTLERPFSLLVPYYRFARRYDVWRTDGGELVTNAASLSPAETVPIQGVPTGPRSMRWAALDDATLVWVEALDGGDPEREVEHRDRLVTRAAPFDGDASEWLRVPERHAGIRWLETGPALVTDYDRDRKWLTTRLVQKDGGTRVLFDRSALDRYGDPGDPVTRWTAGGQRVAIVSGSKLFLDAEGATPEGERPYLATFDLVNGETERIYTSELERLAPFVAFVDNDPSPSNPRFVIRREAPGEAPQYVLHTSSGEETLTAFPDPHPQLSGVKQEVLTYRRADGLELSGRLYRPPGVPEGVPVPTLVWAYPREHADAATASQVDAAPGRFVRLRGTSPLLFLTRGVAVFVANMPVVGDPETVNDTFVEQIVANAESTVDALVDAGVAERDRIAVAGHSYGAFMVANLLAHTDLFKAGIARSGAYNRSLTPFGFQNERRTLWDATDAYLTVSPLFSADQIDEPILLIHGAIDNNSGTWPMQSRRLYEALNGLGGTARLVLLPHEGHGYRARESALHVHAESFAWFDEHVLGKAPAD